MIIFQFFCLRKLIDSVIQSAQMMVDVRAPIIIDVLFQLVISYFLAAAIT